MKILAGPAYLARSRGCLPAVMRAAKDIEMNATVDFNLSSMSKVLTTKTINTLKSGVVIGSGLTTPNLIANAYYNKHALTYARITVHNGGSRRNYEKSVSLGLKNLNDVKRFDVIKQYITAALVGVGGVINSDLSLRGSSAWWSVTNGGNINTESIRIIVSGALRSIDINYSHLSLEDLESLVITYA